MGFDGAFIEERQDLVLVSQMVGGKEAPFDASGLAVMGKHPRPSVDVVPLPRFGQRHDVQALRRSTRYRARCGGEDHQAAGGLVLPPPSKPLLAPGPSPPPS